MKLYVMQSHNVGCVSSPRLPAGVLADLILNYGLFISAFWMWTEIPLCWVLY